MEAHKAQGFVALAILLFITPVVLAETGTPSTEVTTAPDPPTDPKGSCSTNEDGHHTCYNCTTVPICIWLQPSASFYHAGDANCADMDPRTPYCNNGKCSASAPDGCISPFVCTSSGYFPDPGNCRKFYFCVKGKATEYTCSNNFVYSHQKNACLKQNVASDCAVIKCKYTSVMEYVIYPKDPSVYGLCIRDNPTLMFKCLEEEQFDTKTSQCIFVCKKAGLFAVPGDKQKYRECVAVGSGFELNERVCPDGSIFDPTKGRCDLTRRLVF